MFLCQALRYANKISSEAHMHVMRYLPNFKVKPIKLYIFFVQKIAQLFINFVD